MKWDKIASEELYLAAMQVSFDCARCGRCCQRMSGIAYNSIDCTRMAKQLGIGVNEFREKYTTPSPKQEGDRWITLVGEEQKCPFLGEKGCTQYLGRGQVCRFYPWYIAASTKAVREHRPYRIYMECKGMVKSLLDTINIAEKMPFEVAQKIYGLDFGKLSWICMLVDEGKEGQAKKFVNQLGYANLPDRDDLHHWGRQWAAAYLVMMGPRKLANMKDEVMVYAANLGY
jgi:Fe-S-cluster containining protein